MTEDRFDILFVCHANLCRSPMAERLARRAFDDAFGPAAAGVVTASAGTRAFDGAGMHRGTAEVLGECGVDAGGFVSRTVTAGMLRAADLVLTASRDQRAACLMVEPAAVRRAFTLRQFARFAAEVKPVRGGTVATRMGRLVATVNATRHLAAPVPDGDDDLPDPVDQPIEAFRTCAEDVWLSLRAVVGVIAGA
ncbi:low molecular weight phosphatase family protein [Actinoplanes sp. NPDC051494]|uniref:arsenate reductase/protein-tyrosine-phosphatase family protein n=1 Tax=Actinoplanes sp. NPDC051494 TaxID=3363907 RepID=UPI00378B384F